jgi:cell division protein ZapA
MSATNAANVRVMILGSEYVVRGSAEPERITEVARFVDEKLRQAKGKAEQPNDTAKVAILTALNIAYELFEARAASDATLDEVRQRAELLGEQLDACVTEGSGAWSAG